MESECKDLGYINGWKPGKEPPEWKTCMELGLEHTKEVFVERSGPRCLYRYTCPTCGITWSVDMGD